MKKIKLYIPISMLIIVLLSQFAFATVDISRAQGAFNEFFKEYRVILAGVSGLGALTSILVFIFHMITLASMPSHPIKKRMFIEGVIWSGVATGLLGSSTLVFTILFKTVFGD